MSSNMVKPEKFDYLHLVYHFTVPLKHDKHAGTNEFIDSLSSFMYLPYILHPTRVTGHSQTIIDNIYFRAMFQRKQCVVIQ